MTGFFRLLHIGLRPVCSGVYGYWIANGCANNIRGTQMRRQGGP